jgi:hypothetical protein
VAVHFSPPLRGRDLRKGRSESDDFCHWVDMSSRFTKKSLLSVPGRSVNTPCRDPPALAPSARMPPTSTVISGTVRVSRFARSTSMSAGDRRCRRSSCGSRPRSARAGRTTRRRSLLGCVGAPRGERHLDVVAGVLGGLLDRGDAAEHDQVGHRDLLVAAAAARVEVLLDGLQASSAPWRAPPGRWPPSSFCGLEADARAVGAAAHVGARKVDADAQAV